MPAKQLHLTAYDITGKAYQSASKIIFIPFSALIFASF